MGTSQRLRAADVAALYELLDECRELGSDARVWQVHALTELSHIIGLRSSASSEVVPTHDALVADWTTQIDFGWSDAERKQAVDFLTSGNYPRDEFCLRMARTFRADQADGLARTRQQLIDDAAWLLSDTREAYRQMGCGDMAMSLMRLPSHDAVLCVGFMRATGDRPLGRRETGLIELFSRLTQPHLGRGLALCGDPGLVELPPRRREVLAGLLDGLSEKQIAVRLNLSPPTVHEHVTALYRHFGVESRGELLALFLRRRNGPAAEWLARYHLDG